MNTEQLQGIPHGDGVTVAAIDMAEGAPSSASQLNSARYSVCGAKKRKLGAGVEDRAPAQNDRAAEETLSSRQQLNTLRVGLSRARKRKAGTEVI